MTTRTTSRGNGRVEAASADAVYAAAPSWMQSRYWEGAETTRLNSSHWVNASDDSINVWLLEHLPTLRQRSIYESRQNGIIQGMINTHADDIVGQDGPELQVQSEDERYNEALERVWRTWFAAPTPRHNFSGAALLKLWIKNLWRCGEFLARIETVDDSPEPVKMRLMPTHPRRLATPYNRTADPYTVMGVRFDRYNRPAGYFIEDQVGLGTQGSNLNSREYSPDLVIHEFLCEEEDQVRGVPIQATGLQPSADLRDFDDQVQDAARSMADQCSMLYSDHPDAEYFGVPESADIERRTIKMIPPGWKPHTHPATQPPVQYPDYRAERQIELGRPVSMPRLMVRLDASKHSWASARLDMTTYRRAVACFQAWLSGSEKSVGILNRLVDEVAKEARLSRSADSALRRRPQSVAYQWSWPTIDDVEPVKTNQANQIGLESQTVTLTDILASRKKTLRAHVEEKRRERQVFEQAGLPLPSWMTGGSQVDQATAVMVDGDDDE